MTNLLYCSIADTLTIIHRMIFYKKWFSHSLLMLITFPFLLQLINVSQKNDTLTRMNHKVILTWKFFFFFYKMKCCTSVSYIVWFVCQVLDTGWVDLLAPNLDQILTMCMTMEKWLQTNQKHVLVLHCRVNTSDSSAYTDKLNCILVSMSS